MVIGPVTRHDFNSYRSGSLKGMIRVKLRQFSIKIAKIAKKGSYRSKTIIMHSTGFEPGTTRLEAQSTTT